jgi:glycosyltransferase involved in cell wall biosynthesis
MADPERRDRPSALFIAPILPNDRGNGLAMRTGFFLDAYAKHFEIDLAVVPVAGGTKELTPFVDARIRRAAVLPLARDTHFALISGIADPKAQLAAFRTYARPSIVAGLSAELERALLAFVADAVYDLVHVSRLYLASLAAAWMGAKGRGGCLVVDCDEDDASAYRRLARLYRNWGRGRRADWAEAEADAFKALAVRWLPNFDLRLAASAGEARRLSARAEGAEVAVVPNVVPLSANRLAPYPPPGGRRDIVFVGTLGYLPNIDAALWFAKRVWPRLRAAVPFPLRFVIAGQGAPREVMDLARQSGIVVLGSFDDAAPLYRRAALAVVPIRAGGGTRIKLLESAKYGVPVVATRFGAAGTGFRSGQELLVADNERDFAACCARLLTDGELASRLRAQALRKVRHDYDARSIAAGLLGKIAAGCRKGVK